MDTGAHLCTHGPHTGTHRYTQAHTGTHSHKQAHTGTHQPANHRRVTANMVSGSTAATPPPAASCFTFVQSDVRVPTFLCDPAQHSVKDSFRQPVKLTELRVIGVGVNEPHPPVPRCSIVPPVLLVTSSA